MSKKSFAKNKDFQKGIKMKKFIMIQHKNTGHEKQNDVVELQYTLFNTQFKDIESMAKKHKTASKQVFTKQIIFKELNALYDLYFGFPLKNEPGEYLQGFIGESLQLGQRILFGHNPREITSKDTFKFIVFEYPVEPKINDEGKLEMVLRTFQFAAASIKNALFGEFMGKHTSLYWVSLEEFNRFLTSTDSLIAN
ncbi:hypothetical protein MTBBW1_2740004 [Desulfamplus magnetovallimortis]|uniref:Uncharacterized protein n=1 Tax=Desulfamplus magnetovallimortis TaxID=1246637 RepID=A0A1W1HFE2_9BACT|nr:hypothetical protein [Desulfamplus magnetovallimortis]SLM31143.1 hypothetical protein MTBBW1_2740004 [Desulfamplus magnetovallimortis]